MTNFYSIVCNMEVPPLLSGTTWRNLMHDEHARTAMNEICAAQDYLRNWPLRQLRANMGHAQYLLGLLEAERDMQTHLTEIHCVNQAGGLKALGSNDAERTLKLKDAVLSNTYLHELALRIQTLKYILFVLESEWKVIWTEGQHQERNLRERELVLREGGHDVNGT